MLPKEATIWNSSFNHYWLCVHRQHSSQIQICKVRILMQPPDGLGRKAPKAQCIEHSVCMCVCVCVCTRLLFLFLLEEEEGGINKYYFSSQVTCKFKGCLHSRWLPD